MSVKRHVSRSAAEAQPWLPSFVSSALVWSLECQLTKGRTMVYASVCLWYVHSSKVRVLLRREGSSVRAANPAAVFSAWLQASLRAGAWAEGVTEEELEKLAAWELSTGR